MITKVELYKDPLFVELRIYNSRSHQGFVAINTLNSPDPKPSTLEGLRRTGRKRAKALGVPFVDQTL